MIILAKIIALLFVITTYIVLSNMAYNRSVSSAKKQDKYLFSFVIWFGFGCSVIITTLAYFS